ncbi:MAG: poly(A) polymerase, partial [Myxococcota bacterium]
MMPRSMANPLPIEMPRQLPRQHLDTDAVMVCRRLQEAGHETYMVGGCVRDILLGRVPKDFDIGTLATPSQIRRLFRNCRIIGRRFKLAHIVFGSKIIEVATFRGGDEDEEEGQATTGDPEDRLIVRANNFGTPEQDAISRDFTVNALFYDPIKEEILDHV